MDLDPATLGTNLGIAGVVVIWLWKGVLPEIKGMRAELRAIEKHLAASGQARVHLEGAIKSVVEDVGFLVSHVQRSDGRTTRPTGIPEG